MDGAQLSSEKSAGVSAWVVHSAGLKSQVVSESSLGQAGLDISENEKPL